MFVPGVSAWNFGASIMTFLFPEILFVVVATTLFILYTKPEMVPGHWTPRGIERPVSYTAFPRPPESAANQAATAGQAVTTVAEQPAATAADSSATEDSGEAAGTGDAE